FHIRSAKRGTSEAATGGGGQSTPKRGSPRGVGSAPDPYDGRPNAFRAPAREVRLLISGRSHGPVSVVAFRGGGTVCLWGARAIHWRGHACRGDVYVWPGHHAAGDARERTGGIGAVHSHRVGHPARYGGCDGRLQTQHR